MLSEFTVDLTPFESSLVPRPLPLMRRNGLVKQVKFLRLAHFCGQPAQKRYRYLNADKQIFVL